MITPVFRGRYGPRPEHVIPRLQLYRARFYATVAALIGRHLAASRAWRVLDSDESCIVATCAKQARFQTWQPAALPDPFRIIGGSVTPYSGDSVTLRLSARDGRAFEIAQRLSWLPLGDQLATAGLPFSRIKSSQLPLFVVHGRHGGEPIDLSFWGTRRAVIMERAGVVIECHEIIGNDTDLSALMHLCQMTWQAVKDSTVPHEPRVVAATGNARTA